MTDAATNESADLLLQAVNEHLLKENETLRGVQASTQATLDVLTEDLKKRGAQVAQGMLNLAEIAGAAKQQTEAINNQTAAINRLCKALEARTP